MGSSHTLDQQFGSNTLCPNWVTSFVSEILYQQFGVNSVGLTRADSDRLTKFNNQFMIHVTLQNGAGPGGWRYDTQLYLYTVNTY